MKRLWLWPLPVLILLIPSLAGTTGTMVIPQTIANLAMGNQNASLLDQNWTAISSYVNNREVALGTLAARPTASVSGRWYVATDQNGGTPYVDTGSAWTQAAGGVSGLLAAQKTGLTLSMAKHTITVAGGATTSDDATIANRVLMSLTASLTKNTATAWVVGGGNGCLDTGAVAVSTWYHVFLIERTDTGVADVLCSLSATAPTLPTNYTKQKRLTSYFTDTTTAINPTTQRGSCLNWATVPALNVNSTNPGTAAVTATAVTPNGVVTEARMTQLTFGATSTNIVVYVSALTEADMAPTMTAAPLGQSNNGGGSNTAVAVSAWTDTSRQFRFRISVSGVADVIRMATLGWCEALATQ